MAGVLRRHNLEREQLQVNLVQLLLKNPTIFGTVIWYLVCVYYLLTPFLV